MIKNKYKIFLFFCIVSIIICRCKKQDENYYIHNSFKEWTLFKKDSYWVYLDEKSNNTDSSYIFVDQEEYLYSPEGDDKHYEIIRYGIWNIGEFILSCSTDNSYLLLEGKAGEGFINTYKATAEISDFITPTCRVVERLDTLIVNNQKFPQTIHTRDSSSKSINDYYFARKIGLIKYSLKTASTDSTWSLVRYHVVQ